MDPSRLISGDATLIENIVSYLKAKGIFDEFRHECLADVDTKSSCQNLNQRVDGYAAKFLANETWNPDLNKNELRNKLRRHIDESGMLAGGTDHVVDQVINPKIHSFFLPKIVEVVHQYVKEQTELFQKKNETPSEIPVTDASESAAPRAKSVISDPIADILSFTQFKAKPPATCSSQTKTTDGKKKKEEENLTKKRDQELVVDKKNVQDGQENISKNQHIVGPVEVKLVNDKEKNKKVDDLEAPVDQLKKPKEEIKFEEKTKRKSDQESVEDSLKSHNSSDAPETKPENEKDKYKKDNKAEDLPCIEPSKKVKEGVKTDDKKADEVCSQSNEENKVNMNSDHTLALKENTSNKKGPEKSRASHKSKTDISGLKDVKKTKREIIERAFGRDHKQKSTKSSKEPASPGKSTNASKACEKEYKPSHSSKSNPSSSKSSDSSSKKDSKTDSHDFKHQAKHYVHHKSSKTSDFSVKNVSLSDQAAHEREVKASLSSSSQDSSQNSDLEKNVRKGKHKKASKDHLSTENSAKHLSSNKTSSEMKPLSEESSKMSEKHTKSDKLQETLAVEKVRSNSSESVSSSSSSSYQSKENSTSNSDEGSDSNKVKKKKSDGESACMPPSTSAPPPPPPPPSSSVVCKEEAPASEMSSAEDSRSSNESIESSYSADLFSDCEAEVNKSLLDELEKMYKGKPAASISENDFYDIFLYSSSSSDFEGYSSSVEKADTSVPEIGMDLSVSSVHTSELSSFDDELSADEFSLFDEKNGEKLTIKRAQQLLQERAALRLSSKKNSSAQKSTSETNKSSLSIVSSDDETPESEPKRSLRRERKLNPRYASNEYASIFNSRKETFITKQISPIRKNNSPESTTTTEVKTRKRLSNAENSLQATDVKNLSNQNVSSNSLHEEQEIKSEPMDSHDSINHKNRPYSSEDNKIETSFVQSKKPASSVVTRSCRKVNQKSSLGKNEEKVQTMHIGDKNYRTNSILQPDITDSSMKDEKLFLENNENFTLTELQINPRDSQLNVNSAHTVKRKLKIEEPLPSKRPCSQGLVDSSSPESVNENMPYNSKNQTAVDCELFKMCELHSSDLSESVQNQYFGKKWTNNNGDRVLLNSHLVSKASSEKKGKDSSTNKELSAS